MIKKESMYIIVVISLVTGFIGGVVFSAMQSTPAVAPPPQQAGSPAPAGDGHNHTKQQDTISALLDIVKQHPDDYEAWVTLGHNYFDTHQHKKAIEAYDKALSLNNSDPNIWTDMGSMYRREKQPEQAIEAFTEALKRDPNHLIALFNTGLVKLTDLHDVDGAILAWEKAVEVNPGATTPEGKSLKLWLDDLKKTMDK
jgi:cytochrome c-type biogenesis protein CcmH/NrfG